MKLYAIRRPGGWMSPEEIEATAARSLHVGDEEMSEDIRWIRSYVVREVDGSLGTICIYEASSPEKIREHALRSDMPATEIFEVEDTVLIRPDPVAAAA
jgi:thiamine biosynthesis protein ThiC